jgi:DNA-binding response OmpR family regulator
VAAANDGVSLRSAAVLIVEDDYLLLTDLRCVLEDAEASQVYACSTLDEALSVVRSNVVDMAILDVRIGSRSIDGVAQELARRDIPFLFYTGQARSDLMLRAWPDARVVSKPASPSTLVAEVDAAIRRHRSRELQQSSA